MARTVTIKIKPGGEVNIDLKGFKGKGCDAVRKAFERMGDVTTTGKKPEYNAPSSESCVDLDNR